MSTFAGKAAFNAIDHHYTDGLFATASNTVQIWDETKSTAVMNLAHSSTTETITSLRFHHSEPSILGSTGSSRTFTLYDIRSSSPIERQIVMSFQNTAIHFSPLLPTQLLLPSDDHNIYTFDLRYLKSPTEIYKGHVAAVTCAAFSPTGLEFVSGGWDRTIKIWNVKDAGGPNAAISGGRSRDTYHTKRMQRLTAVLYTPDAQHILSGSDDGNIRIWKTDASKKMGTVTARERAAIEYRKALIGRWKQDKEVGKVERRRYMPKSVYQASKLKRTMVDARKEKEERRRRHTREGASKKTAERRKVVVAEQA
jgi:WD repeat and SOF domain-containing protein 1